MVPMMLGTITVMELLTGLTSAAGIIYFLLTGSMKIIFLASIIGAALITALFFGQRVLAKDYPGAAVLVPYFILLIILMYLASRT